MHDAIADQIEARIHLISQPMSQDCCPVCQVPLKEIVAAAAFDCGHSICLACCTTSLDLLRNHFADLTREDASSDSGGGAAAARAGPAPPLRWAFPCAVGLGCPGVLGRAETRDALQRLRASPSGLGHGAPVAGEDSGAGEESDSGGAARAQADGLDVGWVRGSIRGWPLP